MLLPKHALSKNKGIRIISAVKYEVWFYSVYSRCEGWIPVVITGKTYKVLSRISAEQMLDRRFPTYKQYPVILKKAKTVTEAPWVPETQFELRFPPHLFGRQQKYGTSD